ncbi:MAG: hypothetical protein HKN09_13990 [Saprospiraceae bacterium]|nr:hypothetical protein [Saprospiraceae bacterium]
MKQITGIRFLQSISCVMLFSLLSFAQLIAQEKFIYPDIDQAFLKIWLGANNVKSSELSIYMDEAGHVWKRRKKDVVNADIEHFDLNLLTVDLDQLLQLMENQLNKGNINQVKSYAYHFMWEFRSIRQCSFIETYPLDLLWDAHDLYQEINYTIDDPMFGLREWSDFENLVNDFMCAFENYDLMHINQITEWYPGIDVKQHKSSKDKVSECLYNLLLSFESGFQPDYKLPCDELGFALESLFQSYADAKVSHPILPKGKM